MGVGFRVGVGVKDSVGVQSGQDLALGAFGARGALGAFCAQGLLRPVPLATNFRPKAPWGGGGLEFLEFLEFFGMSFELVLAGKS